jgi:hypothetical protein
MVPQIISIPGRLLGLALGMATTACQGSDLTLPQDGAPASLEAVSGGGQQGTIGTQLAKPLVVKLTDGAARPVRQVSLRFTAVPAAEIMPAAVVVTDDTGYASVRVRLGDTEGTQTVEALLADIPASELKTTFVLTALADQPPDGGGGGGDDHGGDDHGNGDGRDRGHGHDHDHGHGGGHDHDEDND